MRIISGCCRGRRLAQIEGRDIRPTSDRVREALFNILSPGIRNARVLDLFAGTGALGLEALSRGAAHAVFVDASQAACRTIQENLDRCRLSEKASLIRHDILARPLPPAVTSATYDLIFMDPPYKYGHIEKVLEKEPVRDLLNPNGILVAEQDAKETLKTPINGLDIFRQKKYSRTLISFLEKI